MELDHIKILKFTVPVKGKFEIMFYIVLVSLLNLWKCVM